ncbi:exodeoxyribonuclease V subunit gamma [Shewanella surugensis]|uniref:RecBCD enzyme subunit RecC n=1 Tax=Shewanella surugensis TaxID=212020 RepID=A0ABT0LGB7_9GAMM|nr:exodeoxyribonuclease V subunit gamma [Shewanella surugensis]MCL1126402.1 exodeoxyribonuclease V subunit gamma [Shewanella surugensis]
MLYLIQSNMMEALSKQLATELACPLPNMSCLQPEHILVQSPGMSTWLRLEIAKHNNIAAVLDFPLPSSFIWQLCHALLDDVPKENAFTKAAMTWKLMDLLPRLLNHEAFLPLKDYLEQDNPLKLYQLCGRIADIFDQYLVYRPDWIASWEKHEHPIKLTQEQAWQPLLWRALIDFNANELNQSQYHRANLHQALFDALDDPSTCLAALPKRLFVFGISSMAPQTLDVIYHLAKRIDVIMLSLSPCQHYWGDIIDPKLRARMALEYTNKKQLDTLWEDKLEVGNPLLANNGKMGRELLDLILGLPESHTQFNFDCFIDPLDMTPSSMAPLGVNPLARATNRQPLLAGVQSDILNLETRGQSLGPNASLYQSLTGRRCLDKHDTSITLRSCHSPLREIETLHDHLLEMLAKNPLLAAKDIVIMMPDVAAYAPYIDAVFAAKQGAHYLPYAIADRGAAQESPLINSFLHLLNINQSRFGLTDILGILEVPAVLRRFGLDNDDLSLIRQWLEQAKVRWGRDEKSRMKQDLPPFNQNSWAFGIKRLLLGYAFSDASPLYHDTLAVEGIEGQSAQALGKLLNFIETIDLHQSLLLSATPITDRQIQLEQMLHDFYDVDDDEREQLQTVREALSKLTTELNDALHHQALSIEVLHGWFKQTLSESRVGQRYLAGSINFCTLMPMRSIPFKIVCLLGMNDGIYPRIQYPVGFDLVAHFAARKGDRSRRLDDRYLFLEALLSAREQLYISYIGHSERDNSERIPSMLVSELVEYCQLCYLPEAFIHESLNTEQQTCPSTDPQLDSTIEIGDVEQAIAQQLLHKMPLQPFDPKLYQTGANSENEPVHLQQSYAIQWCPIQKQATTLPAQDQTETAAVLEMDSLYQAFIGTHPNAHKSDDNSKERGRLDAASATTAFFTTEAVTTEEEEALDLSALVRFYRNPAQYFFKRTLKVDLNLDIQMDHNDEPFSLDNLERYQLQSRILKDTIDKGFSQPDPLFYQKLQASGDLPLSPFDHLLLNEYQKDLLPLIDRIYYLQGNEPQDKNKQNDEIQTNTSKSAANKQHCDIKLQFDLPFPMTLTGRIDDISAKGLVNYRPGTAKSKDLIRVYLRHLCLNAMGLNHPSYLLDAGKYHAFENVKAQQAKQQLQLWISGFYQGQQQPLAFIPNTSYAYVEAEGEHQEKLDSAASHWLNEQTQFGDAKDPHFHRLYRFPDDFEEDTFGIISQTLLLPQLSLYQSGPLKDLAHFVESIAATLSLTETSQASPPLDTPSGKHVHGQNQHQTKSEAPT